MGPPPERHYRGDMLGGLCVACRQPIPAALAGAGILEHPTCDGDWPKLLLVSKRAERLAELGSQTGHG